MGTPKGKGEPKKSLIEKWKQKQKARSKSHSPGVVEGEEKVEDGESGVETITEPEQRRAVRYEMPDNGQNGVFAIMDRRRRLSQLYLAGWSQMEIGLELGISQSTVATDLRYLRTLWEEQATTSMDQRRVLELAKTDNLERMASEAWLRSCEEEVVETRSLERELRVQTEGKGKEKVIVGEEMVEVKNSESVRKRKLVGDPRFLERIQACIELRCKIAGLLKDDKKPNQINVLNIDWAKLAGEGSGAEEINREIEAVKSGFVQVKEVESGELPRSSTNGRDESAGNGAGSVT